MGTPIYRITGIPLSFDYDTRSWKPTGQRVTVHRARNGDAAYYENLEEAKRALRGFKGNGRDYAEYQIEGGDTTWTAV